MSHVGTKPVKKDLSDLAQAILDNAADFNTLLEGKAPLSPSAKSVGSYIFARAGSGVDCNTGSTKSGSGLSPSSVGRYEETGFSGYVVASNSGSLSGTWRCMGYLNFSTKQYGQSLWLRIS